MDAITGFCICMALLWIGSELHEMNNARKNRYENTR